MTASLSFFSILCLCLFFQHHATAQFAHNHKVYVVHLTPHKEIKTIKEIEEGHHSYLASLEMSSKKRKNSFLYSYKNILNGFSAILNDEEAAKLSKMEGVISVQPSVVYSSHTSRSWEFIDIIEGSSVSNELSLKSQAKNGQDVIVGLLDSGLWPESESFRDDGLGPVPNTWKGVCQEGDSFTKSNCNKKIIGARYYLKDYEAQFGTLNNSLDYRSPRDHQGHGSHTSSIVAGQPVEGASYIGGFGRGTVQGGAPLARIAMYKVCWRLPDLTVTNNWCGSADIMAAMDDAINDGVNVLSLSLGYSGPSDAYYSSDPIAHSSLAATKRDIVVVASAGNSGPKWSSVENVSPWILTVAANSIDRDFPAPLTLGDGTQFRTRSWGDPSELENKPYPLVYAGLNEVTDAPDSTKGECRYGTLDPDKVKGKIVFCVMADGFPVSKSLEVKRAGGVAVILANSKSNGEYIWLNQHFIPTAHIGYNEGSAIFNYIDLNKNDAIATFSPGTTQLGYKPSPFMADFSSIGPNRIEPNIIKPDITGPGYEILAAWSESSPPTQRPYDNRVVKYNFDSGTSMSCPHVAAAAVLLRAIHPTWSAAAIRSALMTSATNVNNVGGAITTFDDNTAATPFHLGSGHVEPIHAADPGLVYNASYTDYLAYLCAKGYNTGNCNYFDPDFVCPDIPMIPSNLNYPSVAVSGLMGWATVLRTVTNVGAPDSCYTVSINPPPGYGVNIFPRTLQFTEVGEEQTFQIQILFMGGSFGQYQFGSFTWTSADNAHIVTSPIAISAFF